MIDHKAHSYHIGFSIITCSSTRTPENDDSGKSLKEYLGKMGMPVTEYMVVKDDLKEIRAAVRKCVAISDAVVLTGGTGISKYDVTVQAVCSIAQKEIMGFAMQFQILSQREVGTAAMLSSASAFVVDGKPVFCLPGSPNGAMLGLRDLIIPEINHITYELSK